MQKNKLFMLSLFSILFATLVNANNISVLAKKYGLKAHETSFQLTEVSSNKPSEVHNPGLALIPASVTKVLTTLYSLGVLGDNFRFYTQISYSGEIKNGTLVGDLYLVGGGDPYLKASELFNMALALKDHGINEVKGNYYYDDSLLLNSKIIDSKRHKDHSYNPGVSALSSDFNQFMVQNFNAIPKLPHLKINILPKNFPSNVKYIYRNDQWHASQKRTYKQFESVPIKRPSLYTAQLFRDLANKAGIKIPAPKRKLKPQGLKKVYKHESDSLLSMAKLTLEYSNNLFAELLLLSAVYKEHGYVSNLEEASKHMKKWLTANIPSSFWSDLEIHNGSGLTSLNKISPRLMSDVLRFAKTQKYSKNYYWPILSLAGHSGWIKKRFPDHNLAYSLWGKTGSLDYVSAIAGYIFSSKGKLYSYSIFVNDIKKRQAIDREFKQKAFSTKSEKTLRSWRENAQAFQNELLSRWHDK